MSPRLEGQASADETLSYDYNVQGCLWAGVGGEHSVWKFDLPDWSKALFDTCWNLYSGSGCFDECSAGAPVCFSSTSLLQCGEEGDGDDCLDIMTTACPGGATCSNGSCGTTCTPACTTNQVGCESGTPWSCGDPDGDGCLNKVLGAPCSGGTTCSGGSCVSSCTNECDFANQKGCDGATPWTCGQYDGDTCLDKSAGSTCQSGWTCSGGACVSSCSDDCSQYETGCSGSTPWTCGKTDGDPCWDIAYGATCGSGTQCNPGNGACETVCECSSGPCCDGCSFKSSSTVCEANFESQYVCAWGTACGDDVGIQYRDLYCSGNSAQCSGNVGSWKSASTHASCDSAHACTNGLSTCQPCSSCKDNDGDGYYGNSGCGTSVDCDDADEWKYPGAKEYWDIRDNDCDGKSDEDGLKTFTRFRAMWSSTDWEHRYVANGSPWPSGFSEEAYQMKLYPTDACTNATYAFPGCSTSNGGKTLLLWGALGLEALSECVKLTSCGSPHLTLYLPEGSVEYTGYASDACYTCKRIGYFLTAASAANFKPSAVQFYRHRSEFSASGKNDNKWSWDPTDGQNDGYNVHEPYWFVPGK